MFPISFFYFFLFLLLVLIVMFDLVKIFPFVYWIYVNRFISQKPVCRKNQFDSMLLRCIFYVLPHQNWCSPLISLYWQYLFNVKDRCIFFIKIMICNLWAKYSKAKIIKKFLANFHTKREFFLSFDFVVLHLLN